MSFKVLTSARPIRTAFLLDETSGFDAACDCVVSWSTEMWGGRGSPIALIERDGTLSGDAWQELIRFDPDQVCSIGPVSDDLLRKLDAEFAPWLVTAPKQPQPNGQRSSGDTEDTAASLETFRERIRLAGIPVPPVKRNLEVFQNRPLLLFDLGKDCPAFVRRFLHRNLGTYYQWFDSRSEKVRRDGRLEDLLPNIPVECLQVNCIPSLCATMERIAGKPPGPDGKLPLPCTAPCQLSSIHLSRPFPRGAFDHAYRVVVGSGTQDFLLYWRSCLNEGRGVWDTPFRHCLWVPVELIEDDSFVAALRNWLCCFTRQGNSNSLDVELASASLSTERLISLVSAMQKGIFHLRMRVVTAGDLEASWRKERAQRDEPRHFLPLLNRDTGAEHFEAVERTGTWELRPPECIHADVPSGAWAVDVQIEREEREGGIRGQDWWVLPRRSGRALVTSIFGTRARISRCGLFAVHVERAWKWPDILTTPCLELHLPPDDQVVRALIVDSRQPWFDYSDVRRDRLQFEPVVTGMRIWDAGRKMRALIEIFGGFRRAQHYWERKFWQWVFNEMSGRLAKDDKTFCANVDHIVEKVLHSRVKAEILKSVACQVRERVLGHVKKHLSGKPMTFAEMETVRQEQEKSQDGDQSVTSGREREYFAGDTIVHQLNVKPVTSEEMIEGLEELTELGVLRMGMNLQCPRCHWRNWYAADELRQCGECRGCSSALPLRPETGWSYGLNPFVQHCVRNHNLAEWQAVASLADGMGSFFFTPSSELFFAKPLTDGENNAQKELDVLCVSNGELLIGEVKDCPLEAEDFNGLVKIAKVLRPDRAAIFVSEDHYREHKGKVDKLRNEFRTALEPSGIRGEFHVLPGY